MITGEDLENLTNAFFDQIKFKNISLNEIEYIPLSRQYNGNLWCLINSQLNMCFEFKNILKLKTYWLHNKSFRQRICHMIRTDQEKQAGTALKMEVQDFTGIHKKINVTWSVWKRQEKYVNVGNRKRFPKKFDLFLTNLLQKNSKYYR